MEISILFSNPSLIKNKSFIKLKGTLIYPEKKFDLIRTWQDLILLAHGKIFPEPDILAFYCHFIVLKS